MKSILALLSVTILSTSAHAANLCSKYEKYPRYMKAIETVATYQNYSLEEFCSLPHVWDVEAQPHRLFDRDGEIIPHVRVQQHLEYSSCLFMVNETNYTITSSKCYSGT